MRPERHYWRRWLILRRAAPWRFWLSCIVILLVGLGLAGLVYARNVTVSRKLSYGECQIDYGQSVNAWDGTVEQTWNDRNFHYETKRFMVRAEAPKNFWPNVAESPPTRVSTGNGQKGSGCQADFAGLIDTATPAYRWQGARAVALRLGAPDLKDANNHGEAAPVKISTRLDPALSPPLFSSDFKKAAAGIDDGAQASLKARGQTRPKLLWCFNYDQPLQKNAPCANSERRAGAGYLFVEDNCPLVKGIDCRQVDSWQWPSAPLELGKLTGTNQRGEVNPFNLYLDAVSNYGYQVGTWMDVTFKYSRLSEVANQLKLSQTTLEPGGKFSATLQLEKIGPDLKEFKLNPEISGQPLASARPLVADAKILSQLNHGGTAQLSATYQVAKNAKRGQCYSFSVNFSAQSSVEANNSNQVRIPAVAARYCVAAERSRAYSYDVRSRGDIESNLVEFKALAAETLARNLGWRRGGASFKAVSQGGDFTLVLASAEQMPSFSTGCDTVYSCQVGRYVIINDERWRKATPPWNQAGGSLRNYRHMAVNHEVGHWLGFGHLNCPKPGAAAPVMLQQSVSLQGCKFNPWPTAAEITTFKLDL